MPSAAVSPGALRRCPTRDDGQSGAAVKIEVITAQEHGRRDRAVDCRGEGDMPFRVRRDLAGPARPLDAPIVVQHDAARKLRRPPFCLPCLPLSWRKDQDFRWPAPANSIQRAARYQTLLWETAFRLRRKGIGILCLGLRPVERRVHARELRMLRAERGQKSNLRSCAHDRAIS